MDEGTTSTGTRSSPGDGIGPGDVLRDLLLPLEPTVFIQEHWEKRAAFLRHPARLRSPLMRLASGTREALLSALASPAAERIGLLGFRPEDFPTAKKILPGEARSVVEGGGTVYSMEIQQCIPELSMLVNQLKADLDYPGPIANDGFWSSAGFGLDLHYDLTTAFTLQIEGSKCWRVGHRPAVPGPKERGFAMQGRCYTVSGAPLPMPEPADFMEIVLEPGDVLYVPAGTWHEAKGVEECFAITFKLPAFDVWEQLIAPVLRSLLPDTADWRRAPPGRATLELSEYLKGRRVEVAAALEQLAVGSAPLGTAWSEAVGRDQAGFRTAERQGDVRPLQPSERLAVSRAHPLTVTTVKSPSGADEVVLFHGATRAHLGVERLPFAQKIVSVKSFTVEEATTWDGSRSAEGVRELLAKLLRLGMLERAPGAPAEQMSSAKKALLSKWLQGGSS